MLRSKYLAMLQERQVAAIKIQRGEERGRGREGGEGGGGREVRGE